MEKLVNKPIQEKVPSPHEPSDFVVSAKVLFDMGADGRQFGFLTVEQAVIDMIGSLPDLRPEALSAAVVSQTGLSGESRAEILSVVANKTGDEQHLARAAYVISYELEAFYPEVVGEEERRFAKIHEPKVRIGKLKEGSKKQQVPDRKHQEVWIGSQNRIDMHQRINRDRVAIGLDPVSSL